MMRDGDVDWPGVPKSQPMKHANTSSNEHSHSSLLSLLQSLHSADPAVLLFHLGHSACMQLARFPEIYRLRTLETEASTEYLEVG